MIEFPDPGEHFEKHMERSSEKYITGLKRAGLKPNDTLTNAMIERAIDEAQDAYHEVAREVLLQNIGVIAREHSMRIEVITRDANERVASATKRLRQCERRIRRARWQSERRSRIKTCLPIAILFGFVAWYNFSHAIVIGEIIYTLGSLVFLVLLVI